MSQAVILQGVFDYLVEKLDLNEGEFGIEPPRGNPPPVHTNVYVAVTIKGMTNQGEPSSEYINEWHAVEIVVFKNTQVYPDDRQDIVFSENNRGIDALADKVVASVNGIEDLRIQCSQLLDEGQEFSEPLYLSGRDETEYVAGEDDAGAIQTWMLQRVRFEGLRRYRTRAQLVGV